MIWFFNLNKLDKLQLCLILNGFHRISFDFEIGQWTWQTIHQVSQSKSNPVAAEKWAN